VTARLSILHVDPERGFGGGERQVLGLVRHVRAAGHRQAVAGDPTGHLLPAAAALGVAGHALAVRNHADLWAGRRLARLLASEPYDIVHFHTARAHALVPVLGARRGIRRVVTRRMDYPLRGAWYARWLYNRGVDAVVAISEGVRAVLVSGGVDPSRVEVIHSGVEPDDFAAVETLRPGARARFGVADDDVVLVVLAALETRKGHAVLLDALAGLDDVPWRLLCAGDGSEARRLAARCTTTPQLGPRVTWLGRVTDVAGVLAAADVVVMPSRQEGLGVAALEAMAAGRAVVASAVGGLPEALGRDAGVLVPAGDAAALRAALRRVATDRALARRLGDAGRARVRARFTMAGMAQSTIAVYQRLVGDGDGRITPAA
jgi:glycosyltransferase involved in cell wall biosynthesis